MIFKNIKPLAIAIYCLIIAISTTATAGPTNKEIAFEGFNFKLLENNNNASIDIIGKQGPLKIHAEIVESPTRFFIDVLGVPSKTARSIELNGTIVQKIRVGIHKDKTRIVFDIKPSVNDLKFGEENKSDPNVSKYEYLFNLNSTSNDSSEPIVEVPTRTPTAEATPTVTPTKVPVQETPTPIKRPTSTPIELEEEITKDFSTPEQTQDKIEVELPEATKQKTFPTPTITSMPESNTVPSTKPLRDIDQAILDMEKNSLTKKAILKNVVFQTTSDNIQSSIAVSISQIDTFNLKQVSESKYVLELPATKLRAPHLSLPQYPPDSFKGFVYIKAEETELDSSVIIEVDPGVKLIAEVSQGKLWIKSK